MAKILKALLILLTISTTSGVAQNMEMLDSLTRVLDIEKSDSARCRIMLEIATIYKTSDTLLVLDYLNRVKLVASGLEDKQYMGRFYEILGEMHAYFGYYDLAIIEYDRALAFFSEADNHTGYYETLKEKGNVYLFKAEYAQAMNYYETVLDFYKRNGITSGVSRCLNNMGIIYKNRGQYVEALSVYDESVKYVDSVKNPMQIAQGYINMGNVFVYLGSYERALEYFELALNISEQENKPKEIALCLLNSGVVQNKCGNYVEALEFYSRSLKASREIGDPVLISNCLINIGTNYSEMDRLDEALEYVERGMAMKEELGDDRIISNCYIHLADIYFRMEDYDKASQLFQQAIPAKEELGDLEGLIRSYIGMARVNLESRYYTAADQKTDQALEIALEINALEQIARAYSIKKDIAEARGDFRSAYQFAMNHQRYNDSLVDEHTSRAVMEMEFRHSSKVLEKENENLRIQTSLAKELMKKRNAFFYSILGLAIILATGLLLVAYFLRRLRISSLKLEEKNLVITSQNLKLDTLNRTKDRMMSIIAHDLRGTIGNQLTAIEVLHRVEVMENPGIDRAKLLGNLKHSASYSLALLENLLLWSRLEEKDTYFLPEEISLNMVVTGCISLFDETALAKNISVVKNIDKAINIQADRIMLETIVRNLLSNAIKFSNPGGEISLSASVIDHAVVVKVEDHGIGMSDEQIHKVLNNGGYTRRGTANEKGAGIGMTLVREFTSIHQGTLKISSKEGEGTTMVVSFPVGLKMVELDQYSGDLKKKVLAHYRQLIQICSREYDQASMKLIRKSLDFLLGQIPSGKESSSDHPALEAIQLAMMTVKELGLDALGVSSVLIIRCVEQFSIPVGDVELALGKRTARIVEELLKIADLDTTTTSGQAENMRNLILTLATDFRVILVKIAERLFRMRKLDSLVEKEQIALSCEAKYIYSTLAHRLGLYNVMLEMEDLSMRVLEKEVYRSIEKKLKATTTKRNRFIKDFIEPIGEDLEKEKFKVEIKGRPKAISSIWRKMRKQKVEFEEVYDKFAIRIIIDTSLKKEKADCWRVYSIITDHYQPNPDRLRDWISAPKSNGYESLHTTVVVPGGEWVEVQIRTRRMNEIAEKGLAAHWKYKGIKGQAGIDQWIEKVREALENSDVDANNLIEDLKLSQFSKEIFVFTPNGDLKKFPENASVLDFAFDIHTDVGATCAGAKVNGKNVPIRYTLKNGDKVEILRSKNQKPKVDWLNVVVTSKAKGKIKQALKENKLKESESGKEILKRRFRNWKIGFDDSSIRKVIQHFKYRDATDLYYDVAIEKVDLLQIKELLNSENKSMDSKPDKIEEEAVERLVSNTAQDSGDFLVIDDKLANVDYRLGKCCNPIHGDSIFGFVTISSGITIHRMNCPNAQQLLSRYGYRVVKARWNQSDTGSFPVTLQITGMDDLGIVSNISDVISKNLQVNMRSISIDSNDGMFEGSITLFVKDTQHLEALIRKLKKVKGVVNIRRTS